VTSMRILSHRERCAEAWTATVDGESASPRVRTLHTMARKVQLRASHVVARYPAPSYGPCEPKYPVTMRSAQPRTAPTALLFRDAQQLGELCADRVENRIDLTAAVPGKLAESVAHWLSISMSGRRWC